MNLDQAKRVIEQAPSTWLAEAARVVLAELARLDPSRIEGLESDRAVAQAEVASLKLTLAEETNRANWAEGRWASETLRANWAEDALRGALIVRDEAAAELGQAHVDSVQHARLLRLEAAARQVVAMPIRSPLVRRVRDRLVAQLRPHLTP